MSCRRAGCRHPIGKHGLEENKLNASCSLCDCAQLVVLPADVLRIVSEYAKADARASQIAAAFGDAARLKEGLRRDLRTLGVAEVDTRGPDPDHLI